MTTALNVGGSQSVSASGTTSPGSLALGTNNLTLAAAGGLIFGGFSRTLAPLTLSGARLVLLMATRAEVRADLIEWRAAGFDPLDWINYPENAQRAGASVAQRRAARAAAGVPMPGQSQ